MRIMYKYIYIVFIFSETKNRFWIVWRHRVSQRCRSGLHIYVVFISPSFDTVNLYCTRVSLSLSFSLCLSLLLYIIFMFYIIFLGYILGRRLFFVNDDVYQYTRRIRSKWWSPVNRTLNYNNYTVAATSREIISINSRGRMSK